MVEVRFDKKFTSVFSKIKDSEFRSRVIKQVEKISANPEIGKPMRNIRKNTRELYVSPFRISYSYLKSENIVYILDLYHKKKQ